MTSQAWETGRTSGGGGKFKQITIISGSLGFNVCRMLLGNGSAYAETCEMLRELTEVFVNIAGEGHA